MVLMIKSNRIKDVPDADVSKLKAAGYSLISKKKADKQSLVNPQQENKNGAAAENKVDAL